MNSRNQALLEYSLVSLVIGVIFTTVSTVTGPSVLFYVLSFVSALNWYVHSRKGTSRQGIELKEYKILFILGSIYLLAVLMSKLANGTISGTEIEKAVRFSIGLPLIYAGLRFVPYDRLKYTLLGVYAAIIFQFGYTLSSIGPNFGRPDTGEIYNAVSYAVVCLLFTVIALFSIRIRLSNHIRFELLLKSVVVVIGSVTYALLQTRTGLLAMPVFIAIFIFIFLKHCSMIKKVAILLLGMVAVSVLVFSVPALKDRLEVAFREPTECLDNNLLVDNSVCIRMQLAKASIYMWKKNPLFGTGDNSVFQETMQNEMVDLGLITQYTADNYGEPHNDYFQTISGQGLFGLLGLILLYFAPAWLFVKGVINGLDIQERCIAGMGAVTCIGFAIFGLTELMFRNMRTISFYTVLVAMFIVLLSSYRASRLKKYV